MVNIKNIREAVLGESKKEVTNTVKVEPLITERDQPFCISQAFTLIVGTGTFIAPSGEATLFEYNDHSRVLVLDEVWSSGSLATQPLPGGLLLITDQIGFQIRLSGLVVVPDVRAIAFLSNPADSNQYIHPSLNWMNYSVSPIRISAGQRFTARAVNQLGLPVVVNLVMKGHFEKQVH